MSDTDIATRTAVLTLLLPRTPGSAGLVISENNFAAQARLEKLLSVQEKHDVMTTKG